MKILLWGLVLLFTACTSSPKKTTAPAPALPPSPEVEQPVAIDYPALQRHLGLEKDRDVLGYFEKNFNTCDAGYGYSRGTNCRQENLILIQFRLQCRDSEGTISQVLTANDLRPLDHRQVRWSLRGVQGITTSDADGFVKILTSSSRSQRRERVRVAIGNEFLYMRANEIQKVITPQPWCRQY